MVLLLSVLATAALAGGPGPCSSADDCSLAGRCVSGRCICRAPFAGPACATLAFGGPSPAAGAYANASAWSWGGSPITAQRGEDRLYHLFTSQLTHGCGLLHYQTNSEVVHLTADRPEGPYAFRGVALAPRRAPPGSSSSSSSSSAHWDAGTVHGPTIRFDASRQLYALFYMSTNYSGAAPVCWGNRSYAPTMVSASRRIGVAWSPSLDGPWARADAPILAPSEDPAAWDSGDVSNPAPFIAADGSVLLAYRAGGDRVAVGGGIGIAAAPSFRGPYSRTNASMLFAAEDAVLWREPAADGGALHMLVHAFQGVGGRALDNVGGHAWSRDGARWEYAAAPAYTLRADWSNGSATELYRRERPQLLFDGGGRPTHLFNGAQPQYGLPLVDCDFSAPCKTFTMVTPLAQQPTR